MVCVIGVLGVCGWGLPAWKGGNCSGLQMREHMVCVSVCTTGICIYRRSAETDPLVRGTSSDSRAIIFRYLSLRPVTFSQKEEEEDLESLRRRCLYRTAAAASARAHVFRSVFL